MPPVPARRPPRAADEGAGGQERPANAPECAWVGKRVISLLARDDVDGARQFQQFYAGFHCPAAHIGETFGCIIADATVPEARVLALRVDACWADPTIELSSIVDSEADKAKPPAGSAPAPAQPATRPPADAGPAAPGNNRR